MAFKIKLDELIEKKALELGVSRLSYKDIYAATGILPKTLSRINTGKGNVRVETLFKLCEYFDCTAGNILWRAKNGNGK